MNNLNIPRQILRIPLNEIMIKNLITIKPTDTLNVVKELFKKHSIHHLPVIDDEGGFLGLVSKSDFLSISRSSLISTENESDALYRHFTADRIMIKNAVCLKPDQKLDVAILILLENFFHCVPIVENAKLVGIVTPFDVMRYVFNIENPEHKFKSIFH